MKEKKSSKTKDRITMDFTKYRTLRRREYQIQKLKNLIKGAWDAIKQIEEVK